MSDDNEPRELPRELDMRCNRCSHVFPYRTGMKLVCPGCGYDPKKEATEEGKI